jgi:uncharacterized protein (TIGR04255 family)
VGAEPATGDQVVAMVAVLVAVSVWRRYRMTVDNHEVYARPPVVFVAFELRHPNVGQPTGSQLSKLKRAVVDVAPVFRPTTFRTLTIGEKPDLVAEDVTKYLSRDQRTSITYRANAIVVETTKYRRYEDFRHLVEVAVEARQSVALIDGVERIGLRYINEIRAPEIGEDLMSWAAWVEPGLLCPLKLGDEIGLRASQQQGVAVFIGGADRALTLRHGPAVGHAVASNDLKRSLPPPGPFFLVDIDSYWTASDEIPNLDSKRVLSICDSLKRPIRGLFERIVTDKLRSEVMRRDD